MAAVIESAVMRLTREVRFAVGPQPSGPVANSWAGWPAMDGVLPYITLRACVEGEPDPRTGYLCNIAAIDRLVRERTIQLTREMVVGGPVTAELLISAIADDLSDRAPAGSSWVNWRLMLTPYLGYAVAYGEPSMVELWESFEFSAAHRLHCEDLSAAENQQVFGKCNNPRGHGHNYLLEVAIVGEPDPQTGVLLPIHEFESIVKERVIDVLDHKHLNEDCPAFARLNPSAENIARVIWGLLLGRFGAAQLRSIRVWETPKTCAEYRGPQG